MQQPEGEGGHRQATYLSEYVAIYFAAEKCEMTGSRYPGLELYESDTS
jgi:hypothetical protein